MDKEIAVLIVNEIRPQGADKSECIKIKDFIALKVIKDSDFAELTVKKMNEVLTTAMDNVFDFTFTREELTKNVDLFRDCLKARIKEILRDTEVSASELKQRINGNILKVREAIEISDKEREVCRKLQNNIVNDVIEEMDDIQISYKEFKNLMAEVKEYIFGKDNFFTAKELKKNEKELKGYIKARLKELLDAQIILYEEAEPKLTDEEKKASREAANKALKEQQKEIKAGKNKLLDEINKELKKVTSEKMRSELVKIRAEAEELGLEITDLELDKAG